MTEPIIEFKYEPQAYECLKEWQSRLFLDDWTIKIHFADKLTDDDTGDELSGQNRFDMINKCCVISLARLDDDKKTRIQKVSHEHVLVHELLHCKQGWLSPPSTFEGKYYYTLEHGLLEQMAKSLIMAKYGLTFDWFRNF